MPASRSRTTEWRRSLEQLRDRGGAIEIAVAHDPTAGVPTLGEVTELDAGNPVSADLVWRVRVLDLTADELSVDLPFALGRAVELPEGTALIGAIAIGQNRWMFRTTVRGAWTSSGSFPRNHRGIRLELPTQVERCLRRATRVSLAEIKLPKIEMWPLLDPRSALVAERASQLAVEAMLSGGPAVPPSEDLLPMVGPRFLATLVNLGGGGLGVLVESGDSAALARHRNFWVRFTLGAITPIPVSACARVVHTHIDSSHRVYAGISFSFEFNPNYQRVVGEQIVRAIGRITELQSHRLDDARRAA